MTIVTIYVPIEFKGLWNCKPYVTEGSQVVGRPPLVLETWFTAQARFKVLLMKRDLSLGWIKKLACIIKGLKKGFNAFDPPDNYYS
jgi:hypothetical protein